MKYRRERWETWDDDFIDVDWATPEAADPETPIIVNFHGLEGSSKSHYALALMHETVKRGWRGCVPMFRSCSGELNRQIKTYHAGDIDQVQWILETVKARYPKAPLYAVGVSLSGNQLALFCGKRANAHADASMRPSSPPRPFLQAEGKCCLSRAPVWAQPCAVWKAVLGRR